MGSAIGWGALAASSLVIGAALKLRPRWPARQVGYVLAFGAGALIAIPSAASSKLTALLSAPGKTNAVPENARNRGRQ